MFYFHVITNCVILKYRLLAVAKWYAHFFSFFTAYNNATLVSSVLLFPVASQCNSLALDSLAKLKYDIGNLITPNIQHIYENVNKMKMF